jgi:hypothetical protein
VELVQQAREEAIRAPPVAAAAPPPAAPQPSTPERRPSAAPSAQRFCAESATIVLWQFHLFMMTGFRGFDGSFQA